MIHINLFGEKKDTSGIAFLQVAGFVLVLIGSLGGLSSFHSSENRKLSQLKIEQSNLETELAQLTTKTRRVEKLEENKVKLKEKLRTIASLKAKKHGPVRVLDEINMALPERSWVTGMREKEGIVEIAGIALDNQTLAMFMSRLGESALFQNDGVDLIHSRQYIKDNIKLKEFLIFAKTRDLLAVQLERNREANQQASNDAQVPGSGV